MTNVVVHRNIARASSEFVAAARKYPTGYFVDIQGRRGAMDCNIKPIFPCARIHGSAVTVRTVPDDNLGPYMALEILQPGDVLVVATGGWTGSSVIGDLVAGMIRNCGVAAIVTDGAVRDLEGLEEVGVPVFACALSPNSPQKNGPTEIGGGVAIGGVFVRSGDLIVADRDGVVALGSRHFPTALDELEKIRIKEAAIEQSVANGMTSPDWVKEYAAGAKVEFVD